MTANKEFQVSAIKRILKQKGIDPDLIDVSAMVDSSLSLQENARIIIEDVKLMQEMGQIAPETVSDTKITNFLNAVEIFQRKSWSKQLVDSKRQAKKIFTKSQLNNKNFAKWQKNTNRYDIEGVDSKYG